MELSLHGNQNQMLNIRDALKLYKMLAPYMPEYENDSDILEFVGTIITNIKNSKEPWIFADALLLMHDVSLDVLQKNDPIQNIKLFVVGLTENNFLALIDFSKELGIHA